MRKRLKLVEARARKDWTLQEAAEWIGCAPNTLNRWELGTMNPSAYYRTRLSTAYGMTKAELGLEDEEISALPEYASSSALARLRADFTMYLMALALAEYDTCWQVQDVLIRAIEEVTMNSSDEVRRQQREAVQRLAMLPMLNLNRGQRSTEEILNTCAAGLTACGYLAISNREDMQLAASMIATYLPLLQAITIDSSKHQKAAAALLSQSLQIKSKIGYHLEGVRQATFYAEQAVQWAKKSQHKTIVIMAQRELLGAYEWTSLQHRAQTLTIVEETQQAMEIKRGAQVAPLIQSWVYTGLAKYQALNKQENAMKASLEKAEETFFVSPDAIPIYIPHSHARLMRHKAISYAYLGQQDKALQIFADIIDLNSETFVAKLPMPERTYLGVLSEVMFSSLKIPQVLKDKELSIALWMRVMEKANELQSETYFNESALAFQIMEGIWSDDADVSALRESLVHW